jgi:hypothetical protein
MNSSSHVDQCSVIALQDENLHTYAVWNFKMLTFKYESCSCNVHCYRTVQIGLLWHAQERKCDKEAGGGIAVILLAIMKAACVQLDVTQIWDHNPCREVCNQHGVWLTASGRRLRQNVSNMVNLPKFWRHNLRLDILHGNCNIFQVNFKMAVAHCCQAIHRPGLQHSTATLEWREEKDFPDINITK